MVDEAHGAPEFGVQQFAAAAVARDAGVLLRAGVPFVAGVLGRARVESAYGFAAQAYDAPAVASAPHERSWRNGVALRVAFDGPRRLGIQPAWFARGFEPLVSAAGTTDGVSFGAGPRARCWGGELALANVFLLGAGVGSYPDVQLTTDSSGFGLGLPLGGWGGLRYDHAIPVTEFSGITLERGSCWLDPVALARELRGR